MSRKIFLPVLAMALAILACNIQAAPTSTPTGTMTDTPIPTSTVTETPVPTLASGLTLDMLRNGQYSLEGCSGTLQPFQLVNRSYASGPEPAAGDYMAVYMGDQVAFGDLNDDGVEDAVAALGVNCGGTGVFTYLAAVLDQDGAPVFAAAVFIDDRPMINSLSIVNGEILSDIIIHNATDPMCCPSFQTRWVTWTPDNHERSITVEAPADGADVTSPFTVSGSVTIAPFENNLVYRIYLPDGTLVNEYSLIVDSGGVLGGPGTFSQSFDLSMAGITGPVLIQFLDLSAADGSTMAMGSVILNVH